MEFILIWLVGIVIVTAIGSEREIGGLAAFLISLFLSPLIGLIVVAFSDSKKKAELDKLQKELLEKQLRETEIKNK